MQILRPFLSLMGRYWLSHNITGRIWLTMGVIALAVDAALCYQYGVTQTTWHGIGFAVVALFFSQLPDGAYSEYEKGNKLAGIVLGALCVPLGLVAYQSHIGYGAGVRLGDIKKANVQQAKYDDNRGSVTQLNETLASLESRARELDSELNKLVAQKVCSPDGKSCWSQTVKPSSPEELDEAISAKKLSMDNEAKRVKCGQKCEDRKNELAHLTALRAKAGEIAKNNAKHQEVLDKIAEAKNLSAHTEAGMSSVAMQTDANTQLFGIVRAAWTGEPLETALKTTEQSAKLANLIITAAGSLAFMLMAPIGFFMAGRNRRPEPGDPAPAVPSHLPTAPTEPTPMVRDLNLARVTMGELNRARLQAILGSASA